DPVADRDVQIPPGVCALRLADYRAVPGALSRRRAVREHLAVLFAGIPVLYRRRDAPAKVVAPVALRRCLRIYAVFPAESLHSLGVGRVTRIAKRKGNSRFRLATEDMVHQSIGKISV